MSKTTEIEYCGDCPHRFYKGNDMASDKTDKLTGENTPIPDWCPLPDTHDKEFECAYCHGDQEVAKIAHLMGFRPDVAFVRIRDLEKQLEILQEQGWRDIESAPKDGTEIVGVNDDGIRCVIRWEKHNHVPLYGWIRQVELYGEEVDGFDPVKWTTLLPSPPQEK